LIEKLDFCLGIGFLQQDIVEACGGPNKAVEEQERSSSETDEERIGSASRERAGTNCSDSGL